MKPFIIIGFWLLALFAAPAHASDFYTPQDPAHFRMPNLTDFQTIPDYTLKCESMAAGRSHITLDVMPHDMLVRMNASDGSNVELPITSATINARRAYNEYGNLVMVPYVQMLTMHSTAGRDAGNNRVLSDDHGKLVFAGSYSGGTFAFSCY